MLNIPKTLEMLSALPVWVFLMCQTIERRTYFSKTNCWKLQFFTTDWKFPNIFRTWLRWLFPHVGSFFRCLTSILFNLTQKWWKSVKYFFESSSFLFSWNQLEGPCYRPTIKLSAATVSRLSRFTVQLFKRIYLANGKSLRERQLQILISAIECCHCENCIAWPWPALWR